MDKTHPPTTFGIFKPTHHTLIAFDSMEALQTAKHALYAQGFSPTAMTEFSAEEMHALADGELATASRVAVFGYEVRLLRQHKELAEGGCCFLAVHVPEEKQVQHVAELVRGWKPASAQHYGRFLIEDLTEARPGLPAT